MAVVPDDVRRKAAEPKLEKILSDFEKANDTKKDTPGKNLRELLEKSPDLKARILDSVARGHLEKFALLPAGANAGGTYNSDDKTIELPLAELKKAGKDKSAAAELVFVMGHEIQHSFNSKVSDRAVEAFVKDVDKIVKGPGPHDYTGAVRTLIQNYREDEASAHIGGFNAIASQVLKDNPKAGLRELYNAHPGRMEDFIERSGKAPKFSYALRPGLTLEADMTLKDTPENVKAMGKHYFDQPPSSARLGAKGNQDYPNYYGEWALNVIADAEKKALAEAKKADPKAVAPEVQLDMKDLGLKKSLLDTGLKFTDTSPKKPISASHEAAHDGRARDENPLNGQAMKSLQPHAAQLGLKDPTEIANLSAATALLAAKAGMERIDGVLLGKNGQFFAYQGDPMSESADRIVVNAGQAKQQPAAESLAALANENPQQTLAPPSQQRTQTV
jgi:hypothetical protein